MNLRNPFSENTRALYLYHQFCMDCRSNIIPELHHIAGRRSNSPYNGIVLCHECHSHVGHTEEEEKKYFCITLKFHTKNGYVPTEKDHEFIKSYKRLYDVVYGD